MKSIRASLIVAAGGSGSRFRQSLDDQDPKNSPASSKLFFPLCGQPILARTISAFQPISQIKETIVAVPQGAERVVKKLAREYRWRNLKIVRGGRTRAESVWNGLEKCDPRNAWVMVHDGARPLISKTSVENLFEASAEADGVILACKVVPTIKQTDAEGTILKTIDRNGLFEAETPQLVRRDYLDQAYRSNPKSREATDEASLLESIKAKVKVVLHQDWNPKITQWEDFRLAESYLRQNQRVSIRTGFGRDTHRLVTGRKFILGGIRIPFKKGPLGHSDGDALLHAVSDAILGALGAGDIGDWFSDKNPKYKNISSRKILATVLQKAKKNNFKVEHVDTVIILEKPKLGLTKKKILKNLSELLALEENSVSIKAKTAEGLGPEGEGLAITCEAIVTVRKFQ